MIQATVNTAIRFGEDELFWDSEDTKTCHKCGSSQHLVADCEERESANSFREKRKQFNNIYSKYKIQNFRKFSKANNNNNRNNTYQKTNNKETQIQTSLETILKSFKDELNDKFIAVNDQLVEISNRIKLLEIKTGLTKTPSFNKMSQYKTSNKSKTMDLQYFETSKQLEEFNIQKENKKAQEEKNTTSNNDNTLINETTTTDPKGKNTEKRSRAQVEASTSSSDEASTAQLNLNRSKNLLEK